jgi:hypothetical protein
MHLEIVSASLDWRNPLFYAGACVWILPVWTGEFCGDFIKSDTFEMQ